MFAISRSFLSCVLIPIFLFFFPWVSFMKTCLDVDVNLSSASGPTRSNIIVLLLQITEMTIWNKETPSFKKLVNLMRSRGQLSTQYSFVAYSEKLFADNNFEDRNETGYYSARVVPLTLSLWTIITSGTSSIASFSSCLCDPDLRLDQTTTLVKMSTCSLQWLFRWCSCYLPSDSTPNSLRPRSHSPATPHTHPSFLSPTPAALRPLAAGSQT